MAFFLNELSGVCIKTCSNVVFKKLFFSPIKNNPYYFALSSEKFSQSVKFYSSSSDDKDSPIWPMKRVWRMLKSDMNVLRQAVDNELPNDKLPYIFPSHCDILVVGGGIIGSSIAYWLKKRALSGLSVVVVEKDSSVINFNKSEYCQASTTLSAGGLRQQFSLPENIEMSIFGAEFLRNIEDYLGIDGEEIPNVGFTPQGYLFMATEKSAHILEENYKLQNKLGARNELLTPQKIKQKWPWMNLDDIALGCHGLENEGWLDPWSLLTAFKKKAQFLGAEYVQGELVGFKYREMTDVIMDGYEPGEYQGINHALIRMPNGKLEDICFSILVIAAGHNSGEVGKLANIGLGERFLALPIPVEKRKRYVYCFHCPDGPGIAAPFVIDPSGMYFRREGFGGNYICGRSPDYDDEPSCDNLDVDYDFFNEKVWPLLAQRVPAFEKIKMKSAWAGYYDFNMFDENALIGPHPGYMNVFMATGFSGHGLQQAPAVGRAIMELIVDGHYKTIDLTRMQFERTFHDEFLRETNII